MFGGEHEPRIPVDDVLLSVDTTQPDASWTPVTLVRHDTTRPCTFLLMAAAVNEVALWMD